MKKNSGFTLVELIVVIAILGILAGVAIPVYSGYISKANEAADLSALDAIKTAAVFAYTEKQVKENENTEVVKISYTDGGTTVDIVGTTDADAENGLHIDAYTGAVTFKSDKYSGKTAVWQGNEWTAE